MKTLLVIIILFCSLLTMQSQNNVDIIRHDELELSYTVDDDLPENIILGINGRVFVYNGNPAYIATIKPEETKDFTLVVGGSQTGTNPTDGGIVGRDLALGSSDLYMTMPDFVFEEDYALPSLEDTKAFVQQNKHLPGVIGQQELEDQGYFLVDRMLLAQLQNLEELALHIIEQDKVLQEQEAENKILEEKIKTLIERAEKLMETKSKKS